MRSGIAIRCQVVDVFADYHQFYVQDGGINPAAPEDWSDLDVRHRAKVAENVVVVCPVRDMTVSVEIALFATEPRADALAPDHIVECSLSLPTGHLQVHECTGGSVLDWQLPSGVYAVRLLFVGLNTLSQEGLEGKDRYHVHLWPGEYRPLCVTRAWTESSEA